MTSTDLTPRQHPISQQLHGDRTFGERLADGVAAQIGSWRFLIIQSFLVALWVALNLIALSHHWDPYPFVLLNLLFSVQAAYTGPVLLLSSNRSAQRDRIMAEHDFVTNDKAERLIEGLLSEVLRNSRATLAIAKHLDVQVEELEEHRRDLEAKVDDVQESLVEVEDVLEEEKRLQAKVEEVEETLADVEDDLEEEKRKE